MVAGSGRDAELTIAAEGVDGDGAPSRRCEAGGQGSAYGSRDGHGEAELTAAAARTKERG